MAVNSVRAEVQKEKPKWDLIRDCLDGQYAIKAAGDKYLPRPNPADISVENKARFNAYVQRAVFYNVTKRTVDGLIGQVFLRDPITDVPPELEILEVDADGASVGMTQQAKRALRSVLGYGRAGIFVDYPPTDGATTKEQQATGNVRPTITLYEPWDIINWRVTTVGARRLLSLLVLHETFTQEGVGDEFESTQEDQWRVLKLINGVYTVELYRSTSGAFTKIVHTPQDSAGKTLSEIPFSFIGATNNDADIDGAPIYDMATLNIGHYRNSADYEEACYLTGQPTPWVSGVTESWVKNVFKGGKLQLGSRAAIPLPVNGMAGLLQASPNTMPHEAMEAKERQMVALGAKLVETTKVQRTLGEAVIEEASETSVLSTAAANVSKAYTDALKWAGQFVGNESDKIQFVLSTDYPSARMTPQDRQQLISEWQAQAISFSELRDQLRKAGIAKLDDEAAKAEIDSNPPGNVALLQMDSNNQDPTKQQPPK